jgi:hypothetical protein
MKLKGRVIYSCIFGIQCSLLFLTCCEHGMKCKDQPIILLEFGYEMLLNNERPCWTAGASWYFEFLTKLPGSLWRAGAFLFAS